MTPRSNTTLEEGEGVPSNGNTSHGGKPANCLSSVAKLAQVRKGEHGV
jgi:hypothetical protein